MFTKFTRILKKTERRKDRRIPTTLQASVGDIAGSITDISLGGCGFFPDTKSHLKLGAEIAITLHLKGEDITIPAKIAGHDDDESIYGVAFLELTSATFDTIERIIMRKLTPAR